MLLDQNCLGALVEHVQATMDALIGEGVGLPWGEGVVTWEEMTYEDETEPLERLLFCPRKAACS